MSTGHLNLRLLLIVALCGGWLLPPTSHAQAQLKIPLKAIASPHSAPASLTAVNADDELVYLDAAGYIRVLDPVPPDGDPAVQWVSPTGGWRDVALGDVNNDGDLEIVAIGGEQDSGRLVIYDPVTTSDIDGDRITNQIPWAVLYDAALPGRPFLVATGDLNPSIPGAEIAFVFELNPEDRLDSDDKTRLLLWQADLTNGSANPDGRHWESAATDVDFGNTWEHLTLGDLDNAAGDEIALVDDGVGLVRVYRLEEAVDEGGSAGTTHMVPKKIYENSSGNRPWQDGVVARFVPGDLQQLALARSSSPGSSTFWVLYYNPGAESGFSDSHDEFLLPPPRTIFAGDIDNNGDDEIFLLRAVPTNDSRFRLIMRNYDNTNNPLPVFELALDADNGYTAGTTGDTDGDGRAEVIVMRNNNIRVYNAPESNATDLTNTIPAAVTDQRTVVAGNLDRNGVLKLPQLSISPTMLDPVTVYAGEERPEPLPLRINTLTSGALGPIPFTITATNQPAWLSFSSQNGTTDTTIDVHFDATLLSAGTYEAAIVIRSSDRTVTNAPFTINVVLTVLPGLVPAATSLVVPANCSAEAGLTQRTLALDGPAGLIFSAEVKPTVLNGQHTDATTATVTAGTNAAELTAPAVPDVVWPSSLPWITASSPNSLPTTMQLTFDPTQLAAGTVNAPATLSLVFYDSKGRQERTVAILFFCAQSQLYLPVIRR